MVHRSNPGNVSYRDRTDQEYILTRKIETIKWGSLICPMWEPFHHSDREGQEYILTRKYRDRQVGIANLLHV